MVLHKSGIDAEVSDIGNRNFILGMSCLTEHGFAVNTQDGGLRKLGTGPVIPCSLRSIPSYIGYQDEDARGWLDTAVCGHKRMIL